MKKLANLKGVKTLGKTQQKSIFGGGLGSDTIGGGGGSNVYCRCYGPRGEGFVPNCELCEELCAAIGAGFICTG